MGTFTALIAAGEDDGWVGTTWSNTGNEYFAKDTSVIYNSFLRWSNIAIPQGATIISAKITVKCAASTNTGVANINIYGNNVDDATAIPSLAAYNAAAVTTALTNWVITSWTVGTVYDSPDITNVIQEIVNRAGWASGNALQILIKNNGSATSSVKAFTSYNTTPASSALLTIDYLSGGNTSNFFFMF